MRIDNISRIWDRGRVLKQAFEEYKLCLKDVYLRTEKIVSTPLHLPGEFNISVDKLSGDTFSLRRNIFSTLFQSVYHMLGVSKERRLLYGSLNHLFRVWVTSADNLLDDEDKVVIPIRMAADSHIMRQVISVMAADRVMKQILEEAQEKHIISSADSKILSDLSLQILLPSAAEEASEENGIARRPEPDYVLYTIHRLKTGLLFHIPFLGPEAIEDDINAKLLSGCKGALGRFALGCQILDDIRDMAKDYLEKRHNYILSKIYREDRRSYVRTLDELKPDMDVSAKIFGNFSDVVYPAAELAGTLLQEGLSALDEQGLGAGKRFTKMMSLSMFKLLDVEELLECLGITEEELIQRERPLLQGVPSTMLPKFTTA